MIDKEPARIGRMFDAIAGVYDLLNHLLSAGFDRRWRRVAVESLRLAGGETVLDVCTGTADLGLAALSVPRPAARVVGIDLSEGMLRRGARKIRRRAHAGSFGLVRGDATRLPVRSEAFDAATVAFGLRNVDRLPAALAEMHRSLAARGRVAILEFAVPDTRSVRAAYLWYFTRVLPAIGRIVSGHESAYAYLPASVQDFPPPATVTALLREAGFAQVSAVRLTAGIVYLYTGVKRADSDGVARLGSGAPASRML